MSYFVISLLVMIKFLLSVFVIIGNTGMKLMVASFFYSTPGGNSVSACELTCALISSLAR